MPDFFKQPIQKTTQESLDLTTNKPLTAPLINRVVEDKGNYVDNIYNRVVNDPNLKSQLYSTPLIKTPTKNVEQYLYYAKDVGYDALDPNLEQKYEARQGIWDSVKNRSIKIGTNALLGLYSGFSSTLQFVTGKGSEGITTDSGLDSLSKGVEEINNKFPNFKSQFDIDHPYTNTHIVGETMQSLGFTAGALATSFILDALIAPVTEGIGSAILLPKQLAMITSKWGKLSSAMVEGGKDLKVVLKSLEEAGEITTGLSKAVKNFNTFNKVSDLSRFGLNVGVSAFGETGIEANQTYREIKKNLMDQYSDQYGNYIGDQETLNRIEQTSKEGGAKTVLPNFAFLALSNSIGLASILKPSKAAIKATQEALGSRVSLDVLSANTISASITPYAKGFNGLIERLKSPTALIKDNLRESFEEGYQFVVSDASTNYYERKFNSKGNNDANTMLEEYYKSIGRVFTTEEGIQSMIMGFGGGAIQNVGKRVFNKMRGVKGGIDLAKQIEKDLNQYTTSSIFNGSRNEVVTSQQILEEMDSAAASGDILKYKNAQLEALFNWVHSSVKNNRFDTRLEQLESLKGIDSDSFQTMWGVDFNQGSKNTVDAYIDAVANKAKSIKAKVESIERAFPTNSFNLKKDPLKYASFENYKQELALTLSQIEDNKRRVQDIRSEVSSKLPAINNEDIEQLTTSEGTIKTIEKFSKRIEELKNSEELSKGNKDLTNTFKEEREFLERIVNEMYWAKEDNKSYTQDYLGTINSIHNYYGNGNSVRGSFSINELDSYNILANSKDVNTLLQDVERASNYYRELTGVDGFSSFESKYTRKVKDYIDDLIITEDGKVRVKEKDIAEPAPPTVEDKAIAIQQILEDTQSANVEDLKKDIKEGNIVVKKTGLIRRDPNDPKTTELEIAEAEAMLEYYENEINPGLFDDQEFDDNQNKIAKPVVDDTENIREKAAKLEQDPVSPKGKKIDSEKEDSTIDVILVEADKIWKNATFKFYNFFNKINAWQNTKTKEDYIGSLMTTLLTNSKEDVIKNLTFKLEVAEKSKKITKVPLFVKQSDGTYTKEYTDLKSGPYTHNVEIWYKNKKIGILQEPERLGVESADGSFVPLGSITDPQIYSELTKNNVNTYDAFREQYDSYKTKYDTIVSQQGKKKVFNNKELLALFNPMINYGRIATTKDEKASLKVSELNLWQGSGIIHLNKDNELIIINEDELTPQDLADLISHIGKSNIDKLLRTSGRDYFVISKLPDGTFKDDLSVIFARTNDINVQREDVVKLFKSDENLEDISIPIRSKEHGTTRLVFKREDNGDITMTLRNSKRSVKQPFTISNDVLNEIEDSNDVIDVINNLLKGNINNPLLRKIDMQIGTKDFYKIGITSKSLLKDVKENLKAAVSQSNIYSGFSINFYPKGFVGKNDNTIKEKNQPEVIELDIVPEIEYLDFIDNNKVSQDRLESIADKIIVRKKLSLYETTIFTGKTSEINEIIKKKAESNNLVEEKLINDNITSILSQLEGIGFLTKNCD